MRYHYEKPNIHIPSRSKVYRCHHPVYNKCTLYSVGNKGLAVIQQYYDKDTKKTWWAELDPWIVGDLYSQPGFFDYFNMHAGYCRDGIYPTVTVRQIMWALKMKPMKKQPWETSFDHCPI